MAELSRQFRRAGCLRSWRMTAGLLGTLLLAGAAVAQSPVPATSASAIDGTHPLALRPPLTPLFIRQRLILLADDGAREVNVDGSLQAVQGGRAIRGAGIAGDGAFAYVAGGLVDGQPSDAVWRVDLDAGGLQWKRIATLPMPLPRAAAAVNSAGLFVVSCEIDASLLFVRVQPTTGAIETLLLPADFKTARSLGAQSDSLYLVGSATSGEQRCWRRKDNTWTAAAHPPGEIANMAPVAIGQTHLLWISDRPGDSILAYHTITDTWRTRAVQEGRTVALLPRKDDYVRIAQATGGTLRAERHERTSRGLSVFDYAALGGYFAINLGIGFWCSRRNTSSDQFFRGGGRLQWWALGISYMATGMSSISFMAYPAMGYSSNWLLIGVPVFQSAAVVLTGFVFIRMLRRLNITTVFEYLERRFGRGIRVLGATFMILSQVGGRLSVVMLLPSMAFSAVSGLNVYASVAIMGLVTVIYCLKGGMKAVVWTDVLQFVLMYGAIGVAVLTIARNIPGGLGSLISIAAGEGKFRSWQLDLNLVQPTVWVFALLSVTTVFLQLGDQALMQRALSAPDEKAARNSVVLGGVLTVPIALMLFFVGTALFVFYKQHPERLDVTLPTDSIFPWFVGTQLAPGLVGLIIAGIFAAAMSTVSGTVNAISAIVVRDFLPLLRVDPSEAVQMRVARGSTVIVGVLATLIATVMASMNIQSLWETFAALMALIGGGFPGIFALGLLTRRANAPGAAIGLIASIAITLAVRHYTQTNIFLFTTVAVFSCIAVGYAASLLFPRTTKPLEGLTVHTLGQKVNRPSRIL